MPNPVYLYSDFQRQDGNGRLIIDYEGMDHEVTSQHAKLVEGMHVRLYDGDLDDSGQPALLVADGVLAYDPDARRWVAVVARGTFRHEGNPDRQWRFRK